MTEYVVASIGGSGSRLMAKLISDATGRPRVNDEYPKPWPGNVLHTHRAYHIEKEKLDGLDWKAVFIYGDIGNLICSMYERRISTTAGFRLMGVDAKTRERFEELFETDPVTAWLEIIDGDAPNWRGVFESWFDAPNTMVVNYEMLCLFPDTISSMVRSFLGVDIETPKIIKRKSNWLRLPKELRDAIRLEYGHYIELATEVKEFFE